MALKKFTCTRCDKEFEVGQWECSDGKRHEVASKEYYSPNGSWRTYVSEDRVDKLPDGRVRTYPARAVQFNRGTYRTTDPEDQYTLDTHPGLIPAAQWQEIFIVKEERLAMRERELKAKEERLAKIENDLLSREKAKRA